MPKTLGSKAKMGGLDQKVPRQEKVPDSLAGNYDALKSPLLGFGGSRIGDQTANGTSASMQNTKMPNMGEAVIGQPTRVSAKNFKSTKTPTL